MKFSGEKLKFAGEKKSIHCRDQATACRSLGGHDLAVTAVTAVIVGPRIPRAVTAVITAPARP